jgi:hypothetical protein
MSNHFTDIVHEDLVDEFYDDVDKARDWLEYDQNVVTSGLSCDELCDLFVEYSLAVMQ